MSSAINTSAAPANASESGPSSSSSNPLQRPRSKSRTIIRMLTTKFSHPSAPNDTHDASPSNRPSSPPPTSHTHALHLKIPKPSKPKAPPKVAPTAFADPAARAAALRARGLLPPLPVPDLSEQERERDARLPILDGVGDAQTDGKADGTGEQSETAADRIKREWAMRNGIEISSQSSEVDRRVDTDAVVEVEADPQRARMRTFKFGGGSTPVTPTADTAPTVELDDAQPEREPVTPIALDIDVSLIDFSEPVQTSSLAPSQAMSAALPSAQLPSMDAAQTITAGEAQASTRLLSMVIPTTPTTPPALPSAEATAPTLSSLAAHELKAENVNSFSIEISPPAVPVTAPAHTAHDSDHKVADNDWDTCPGSSAKEVQVPAKSENITSGLVLPQELPALPPSATPAAVGDDVKVVNEEVKEDDSSLLVSRAEPPSSVVAVPSSLESGILSLTPAPSQSGEGAEGEKELLGKGDVDAEQTALSRPSTPPLLSKTPSHGASSPPTSPLRRDALSQTPPASPPPVRTLPPLPGATVRRLPSLPEPEPAALSLPPPYSVTTLNSRAEAKNLQPLPMLPSLSSDTQTSNESEDSADSSSTTDSAPIVTPVTPAFVSSNNPFANWGDAEHGSPRVLSVAKGKLGNLSVKTQGGSGMGVLPVLVHSPATESMQGIPLEVVQEESHDGWLDSQATTPAAVSPVVEKNPADNLLESMGLDKGTFSGGLAEDNSLALGLGLDMISPGTEQAVPTPPTPLSPNRVPAVTISTPSTGATPRTKKRGMTDPGAPERRRSLFGGFRKGDATATNEGGDGAPQRRVSVVASLGNLRRSVVGTIAGTTEKKERDKKAASRSRSPRRFDASHLPPSPSPFSGFSTGNAAANMSVNVNVNDAYRNDGTPSSPRTTSSHGSGSVLSHANSTNPKTVLAPGSAPQLRRGAVPSNPMLRRTAVEPVMYSHGTILLEAANIEDEETRRMTEMAFLG